MPTEANERLHAEVENGTLERLIDPAIPFDIAECRRRKAQVVALLERMAKLLVTREAARVGADSPWASVRVFGSSAIGADVVSSDLDLYVRSFRLLLVPRFVNREAVFAKLPELLGKFGNVADVKVVSDARVQLLKFVMHGVQVDVVSVCVDQGAEPSDHELGDVAVFDRIASDSRMSLNGIRTAIAFRTLFENNAIDGREIGSALHIIKLWAKSRHVYGHNYAYPSGASLAVMAFLAAAALPAPARAVDIIHEFFEFATQNVTRAYPSVAVISAADYASAPTKRIGGLPETWTDATPPDPFTVLTPSYPHVNSNRTMCHTSARVFAEEVARARAVLAQCREASAASPWSPLIHPPRVVRDTTAGFIVVEACSERGLVHDRCVGYMESKIRFLWYCAEASGLAGRLIPVPIRMPDPSTPRDEACTWMLFMVDSVPAAASSLESKGSSVVEEFTFFARPAADLPFAVSVKLAPRGSSLFTRASNAVSRLHDTSSNKRGRQTDEAGQTITPVALKASRSE